MIAQRFINSHGGFTLVEMIVVVVLIGILASVALQSGSRLVETGKVEETRQEMEMLVHGIAGNPEVVNDGQRASFGYVGDVGAVPPNLNALHSNPGYTTWRGPYVSRRFEQISDDHLTDAWGTAYSLTNGIVVSSTGSGSSIEAAAATSVDELVQNSFSGSIYDLDGTPPGTVYKDSIVARLTIPNGLGSTTTKIRTPNAGGFFAFDSLPIGRHDLRIVYAPTSDTIARLVTVLPASADYRRFSFGSDLWSGGSPGGGPGPGMSATIRPNAAGSYQNLTSSGCASNWQCVDESSSDEASSLVRTTSASYSTDSYGMENPGIGSGTIDSIRTYMRLQRAGTSSARKARFQVRTGGSDHYAGEFDVDALTSFTDKFHTFAINPSTGSAWSWTQLDALEAGPGLKKESEVTQFWVVIYYH